MSSPSEKAKEIYVIDRKGEKHSETVAGKDGYNEIRMYYGIEFLINPRNSRARGFGALSSGETYTLPPEDNGRASLVSMGQWKYKTPGAGVDNGQHVRFKEGSDRKRSRTSSSLVSMDQWKYKTPGGSVDNDQHVRFKEGSDRKKSKSSSRGARLDDADLDKVNILVVALEAYQNELSEIKVPDSPFRKPELGKFTRVDMGHTEGKLDTRLTKSLDNATPGGKELCDNLEMKQNVILLGKSGCGKTSAIFDAAHKYYCVLFTASAPETKLVPRADPGGFDYSFSQLVTDLTDCLEDKKTSEEEKEKTCDRLFEALIVARLLILFCFQRHDGATSQLWLVYQLQVEAKNITADLYGSLARRSMRILKKLRAAIVAKLGYFFYAFDEAQVGYKLLQDKQRIWKSTTTDEITGMGGGFVRRLAVEHNAVVIAGTAMSLGHGDIGKLDGTMIMRDFPALSLGEIKKKLKEILDLDDVELGDIPSLWKLEGRGRLFGGLFWRLFLHIKNGDGGEKKAILEKVVQIHYDKTLSRLEQRIKDSFPMTKDPIMREGQRPAGLCKLAIASLWGGTVSFSAAEYDQDLLHVGLCSVKEAFPSRDVSTGRKAPMETDYFILDEQLGREAIQRVAQERQAFLDTFSNVLGFCKPAAGHAMEPLFVGELKRWCERKRETQEGRVCVIDFLNDLFEGDELPGNMPDWVKETPFQLHGAYDRNSYVSQGLKDDIDFVIKAIGDPKFRNKLLSPSTVKRPDFEAVMGVESASTHWFLSVSSKLYSSQYDDTSGADLRSTDPRKFYCKKEGDENSSCRNLRRRWMEEVIGKDDNAVFERCLRIHLCLPDVKHLSKKKQYIWVDDKSVVLYITANNASRLFQAETIKVLKSFGYLRG